MNQYILSLFALALLAVSCTRDFEEINTNPNAPERIGPQFLLSNVVSVAADRNTYEQGHRLANYLAQFAASVEFERIDRYEMGTNGSYWNQIFRLLTDIESMNVAEGSNEAYEAVGDIMRSYLFSQLTDMWGDVPYTNALQAGEGNFTPVYDTQERIYTDSETGILAVLENAAATLENTSATIQGDVMFGGDLDKWVRFANSLRVRYLLRISKRLTDFSELQALADSDKLMRDNGDNAIVPYLSAAPNQWPMSQASEGLYQEHRMTLTVESVLKQWDDPRIDVLYRPVGTDADGNPIYNGLLNGQSRETIDINGIEVSDISLFGPIFRDVPDGIDGQFMQYAELQFAFAEAVARGYISGDAEAYYQAGIAASFEYWGVVLPTDYFEREAIALDGTDDLTKILTQKWLSLLNNGHEAWFNVRRTGIPQLTPGPDNLNDGRYPVRYLYPESEQATNAANYQAAAERIGGDDINSQGWWERD